MKLELIQKILQLDTMYTATGFGLFGAFVIVLLPFNELYTHVMQFVNGLAFLLFTVLRVHMFIENITERLL